jgi:hypothetical protein
MVLSRHRRDGVANPRRAGRSLRDSLDLAIETGSDLSRLQLRVRDAWLLGVDSRR